MDTTRDFFTTLQHMRGYRSDTFPAFYIRTDAADLTGCTMRVVIEDAATPGSVAYTKLCTAHTFEDGTSGFSVQFGSSDTAALAAGRYTLHFILTDAGGNEHRNLVGSLTMLDIPQEV